MALLSADCRLASIEQSIKRLNESNTVQQIIFTPDIATPSQINNDRTSLRFLTID